MLQPGGVFLTQQLGGDSNSYRAALGLPPVQRPIFDLQLAREQLEAAGLRVLAAEVGSWSTTFADAGAFAYWLRAIPWLVEDFSVSAFRTELAILEQRLTAVGPLTMWLVKVPRPSLVNSTPVAPLSIEEPALLVEAVKAGQG